MITHKEKQALLFKLKEPSRITTVIPTARRVLYKGQKLLAVPHRPDETRVLRQLGFRVPDPIKTHYKWPGRYIPFGAQMETASFLTMHDRCWCLNSMGLGKTVSALWAFDYMKSVKQVKRALIVCPLSTMERTWSDEIFRSFPHLNSVVLYGSAERRRKLLKEKVDLYIINTDGIKTIREELAKRPDINLIVVDEVALFRNAGTARWKTLNVIANYQTPRKVWGLTGSPTPNEPTDAWAQCRLITPTKQDLPRYYNKFRDMVMRQVSMFKWVAKDNATDTVRKFMQPAIRYALDDVVDLPEQIHMTRDVELTPEQTKAYTSMLQKLAAEYEGGQILAVNEAVKVNKLLQIVCGVAYGQANHEDIVIPSAPRVDVVKEVIEESEGKVIVFVPFTSALEKLAEELATKWPVEIVHGGTSKNDRDRVFGAFQNAKEPHVIVANPGTMSHGLTLTAATTIVWFAPVHSGEIYEQANARVRRPGQKKTTVIAHVAATATERRIYERLKKKQKMQGVLLDLIAKENLDEVV